VILIRPFLTNLNNFTCVKEEKQKSVNPGNDEISAIWQALLRVPGRLRGLRQKWSHFQENLGKHWKMTAPQNHKDVKKS
jgi:hypothetical protein